MELYKEEYCIKEFACSDMNRTTLDDIEDCEPLKKKINSLREKVEKAEEYVSLSILDL